MLQQTISFSVQHSLLPFVASQILAKSKTRPYKEQQKENNRQQTRDAGNPTYNIVEITGNEVLWLTTRSSPGLPSFSA